MQSPENSLKECHYLGLSLTRDYRALPWKFLIKFDLSKYFKWTCEAY